MLTLERVGVRAWVGWWVGGWVGDLEGDEKAAAACDRSATALGFGYVSRVLMKYSAEEAGWGLVFYFSSFCLVAGTRLLV